MQNTPILNLPLILAAQAQKHVTHNEALQKLDALTQLGIIDISATAATAPNEGDRYIISETPSGIFTGQANKIAAWQLGNWVFYSPAEGWMAWVGARESAFVFHSGKWQALSIGGAPEAAPTNNTNNGLLTSEITIEQNNVGTIPTPTSAGFFTFYVAHETYPQIAHSGIFLYDAGITLSLSTIYTTSSVDVQGTTALTGTSGDSAKTGIAVQTDAIQLQNRRFNNPITYRYAFLT